MPSTSDSPRSITASKTLSVALSGGGATTSNLSYAITSGVITLSTNGTLNFGTKPGAEKPRFVWLADGGDAPNATLGRRTIWGSGDGTGLQNGDVTTDKTGVGQTQSYVLDHSLNSGGMLAPVDVGPQRKKLVHRRRFEDFDSRSATAIRTRIEKPLISGTLPDVGDTVTGQTSGATGVVVSSDEQSTRFSIFYSSSGGTINNEPATDFEFDEVMSWTGGSGTNAEGSTTYLTGTFRTFNNKVIRFYALEKDPNYANVYCGDGIPGYVPNNRATLVVEGIGGNRGDVVTDTNYSQTDYDREWNTELFLLTESSAVDVSDGSMIWKKNGTEIADGSANFITRSTEWPDVKETVYQIQVSNGASPGTKTFFDYLYIDDSHYFVQMRNSATGRFILLPIKTWDTAEITCVDIGLLPSWTHLDIYKDGVLEGSIAK